MSGSALLGAVGGILVADYFVIRRTELDLPGLYSLQATTTDEQVAVDALEGKLFRGVLENAASEAALPCSIWRERDLYAAAAKALGPCASHEELGTAMKIDQRCLKIEVILSDVDGVLIVGSMSAALKLAANSPMKKRVRLCWCGWKTQISRCGW